MKQLEERILSEGVVKDGDILIVGGFLNQKIDTVFTNMMAKEAVRRFSGSHITKIMTIEASGIAFGFAVASILEVPLVFIKKSRTFNQNDNIYYADIHSFTHGNDYRATIAKEYLNPDDSILIVDDFLSDGCAMNGMIEIIGKAGAELVGCVAQIEKGYRKGGDSIRKKGIRVESLAIIDSMKPGKIVFRKEE